MAKTRRLILASGSAARRSMLTAAGLDFEVILADVDEAAIKDAMLTDGARIEGSDIALNLASAKAITVSQLYPQALVIGADQVLCLGARTFSKAKTRADARQVLDTLRGRTHELVSAVALAENGQMLWQTFDLAKLAVREFSEEFLELYLQRAGDCLTKSVGAYEFEGLGSQLFERVKGDYYTILGMPLLPLLAELRNRGMLIS